MANAATHHNAHIVDPFLPVLLPLLYEALALKRERTVDLGPFKHKVDDALPLRKVCP